MSRRLVLLITLIIGIYAYFNLFTNKISSEFNYAIMSAMTFFTLIVGVLQMHSKLTLYDKGYAAKIKQKKETRMKKRKYAKNNNDDLEVFIVYVLSIISVIFMLITYDVLTAKIEYTHILSNLITTDNFLIEDLITFFTIAAFSVFFLSAYIPIFFKKN